MFVRIFILVAVAVLVWSATAHSSQAHGRKQVVTVKPYDTLWSIAQRHYGRRPARGDLADREGEPPARRRRLGRAAARASVAPRRHSSAQRAATIVAVDLDIVFLGTSASAPTAGRAPTALLVRRGGDRLLFDCAEGTQRQLMRSSLGLPDLEADLPDALPRRPHARPPGAPEDVRAPRTRGAAHRLRAAGAARAVRRPPPRVRQGARTRWRRSRCVPARRSSATATGSSSSPCTTASPPSATRSTSPTGPASSTPTPRMRSASRSGRSAARSSAASR